MPPRLKVPSTAAALQGTLGQSRDGMAINGLRAAALQRRPHHRAIGKVVNTRCQRLETSPRVLRKVDGASHHSKGEQWSQRPPRLGGGTSSGRCAGSTGGHQPQRTMLKVSVHLKSASCSPRSRCIFPSPAIAASRPIAHNSPTDVLLRRRALSLVIERLRLAELTACPVASRSIRSLRTNSFGQAVDAVIRSHRTSSARIHEQALAKELVPRDTSGSDHQLHRRRRQPVRLLLQTERPQCLVTAQGASRHVRAHQCSLSRARLYRCMHTRTHPRTHGARTLRARTGSMHTRTPRPLAHLVSDDHARTAQGEARSGRASLTRRYQAALALESLRDLV